MNYPYNSEYGNINTFFNKKIDDLHSIVSDSDNNLDELYSLGMEGNWNNFEQNYIYSEIILNEGKNTGIIEVNYKSKSYPKFDVDKI